jgi:hypothetical protein
MSPNDFLVRDVQARGSKHIRFNEFSVASVQHLISHTELIYVRRPRRKGSEDFSRPDVCHAVLKSPQKGREIASDPAPVISTANGKR